MSFTRSSDGLSNYNAFLKTDVIIFSEGGNLNNPIDDTECNIWSIDSIFWKAVFKKYWPEKKIRIKSLGGKNNVLPYAKKIAFENSKNCVAVMDRDHDAHSNEIINHPRVIYTFGYSWENDAWRAGVLISALCELHPNGKIPDDLITAIHDSYDVFFKRVNRLVFFDVLCSMQKLPGIPEDFGTLVDVFNGVPFKVKRDSFKATIKAVKSNKKIPFKYHGKFRIVPAIDCYGKLMAEFGFGVLTDHYKKFTGSKTLNRQHADYLIANAMEKISISEYDPQISAYYNQVFCLAEASF